MFISDLSASLPTLVTQTPRKLLSGSWASKKDFSTEQLIEIKLRNKKKDQLKTDIERLFSIIIFLNVGYKEINIATVDGAMDEMISKANGKRTIPQIFFDDQHMGGYDDVRALEKDNKLQDLLK